MNIQISNEHIDVINEMIALQGLSITAEDAVMEMLADNINGIERILSELKELKAMQNQTINLNQIGRPKLYLVK